MTGAAGGCGGASGGANGSARVGAESRGSVATSIGTLTRIVTPPTLAKKLCPGSTPCGTSTTKRGADPSLGSVGELPGAAVAPAAVPPAAEPPPMAFWGPSTTSTVSPGTTKDIVDGTVTRIVTPPTLAKKEPPAPTPSGTRTA